MYSQDFGNFQKKVQKNLRDIELSYGPELMSYTNTWLVCVHSALRRPNQLPLTIDNDQVTCEHQHIYAFSGIFHCSYYGKSY